MNTEDRRSKDSVKLPEEVYGRAPEYAEPEHTDVHHRMSRWLELLEDALVVLVTVTLLALGLMLLWIVWQDIVVAGDLQRGISNIIFVIITVEVYRLLVHYLRHHRVDLNLLVEVGVAAMIQKVILVGVDKFTMQQLLGMSATLVVLGGLLWVHMREKHYGKPLTTTTSSSGSRISGSKSATKKTSEDR